MAATEDFSFPTFTDTFSRGMDSPPLWRLSPAASPDSRRQERSKQSTSKGEQQGEESDQEEEEEEDDDDNNKDGDEDEELFKDCFPTVSIKCATGRKSFTCIEKGANKLVRRGGCDQEDDKEEKMDMLWEDFNEELLTRSYSARLDSDVVNVGCVQALRTSKNSGVMLSPRKPSFVVLVKALKKVFLLQHSRRSVKPQTSHRPTAAYKR